MKKLLSVLLCAALLVGLAVPVLATNEPIAGVQSAPACVFCGEVHDLGSAWTRFWNGFTSGTLRTIGYTPIVTFVYSGYFFLSILRLPDFLGGSLALLALFLSIPIGLLGAIPVGLVMGIRNISNPCPPCQRC